MQRADLRLQAALDEEFREAADRAGDWLVCRPGCDACCIGPFPITRLDAWRLARGLAALDESDPARAEAIVSRARAAVETLTPDFPGEAATGCLDDDEAALDRFFEHHRALPCPALDPDSGRCELYAWRPVSCRTYGPPALFDGQKTPPCELCFIGANEQEIERCRYEPDRAGLERELLAAMGFSGEADRETLIAFALVGLDVEGRRRDG